MTATQLWPPRPGYYRMRLAKKAPWSAVRIWLGQAPDPDDGQLRGMYLWRAEINGREVDIHTAWPYCAGQRIDVKEYDYIRAVHRWAVKDAPFAPEAKPREAVLVHNLPPVW